MKISFTEPDLPRSGAVVVGVWEGKALTPAARRLDEATGEAIARALSVPSRFSGKKDELLPLIGSIRDIGGHFDGSGGLVDQRRIECTRCFQNVGIEVWAHRSDFAAHLHQFAL